MDGARYESKAIALSGRNNVTITNIYASVFYHFIWINGSSNITVEANRMDIVICYALTLIASTNITIIGNELGPSEAPPLHACLYRGISIDSSTNILIQGNVVRHFERGIELSNSHQNQIIGNTITVNGEGIVLQDTSKTIIAENTLLNNTEGIFLKDTTYSNLSNNVIAFNGKGIGLEEASGNTIASNNVTNNVVGIELFQANNNTFYHNNFLNNAAHVYDFSWDRDYLTPSINQWNREEMAGNHWSDYTERYPTASERDGAGIWDTPYGLDDNNQDAAPLVEPIPEFPSQIMLLLLLATTALMLVLSMVLKEERKSG
jgi:parallel beta-helix repeat protein